MLRTVLTLGVDGVGLPRLCCSSCWASWGSDSTAQTLALAVAHGDHPALHHRADVPLARPLRGGAGPLPALRVPLGRPRRGGRAPATSTPAGCSCCRGRSGTTPSTTGAVWLAPVTEETLKGLGVLLIYLFRRREFDGIIDGIVYAGLIGAGFAFSENILYLGQRLQRVRQRGAHRDLRRPWPHGPVRPPALHVAAPASASASR